MQNEYVVGDKVEVFTNSYHRSRAEVGEVQVNASRPATIERQMLEGDYSVVFTDGAEPSSAFVDVHVLMLAADVKAAAKAAAKQQ